jgi:hypothetical protein
MILLRFFLIFLGITTTTKQQQPITTLFFIKTLSLENPPDQHKTHCYCCCNFLNNERKLTNSTKTTHTQTHTDPITYQTKTKKTPKKKKKTTFSSQ